MSQQLESHVDVLIIGAGPAGLAAAYWMAQYGIKARIIDKRGTKVFWGHADGLRPSTLELFDSMGFQHRIDEEGINIMEMVFWGPDESGKLKLQGREYARTISASPFRHTTLAQGRIERCLLDAIRGSSGMEVERGVIPELFEYDESCENEPQAFPITVKLRTLSDEEADASLPYGGSKAPLRCNLPQDEWSDLDLNPNRQAGSVEYVKAKYLIGCDGAHSWTRKTLGISVEEDDTENVWGVIDVVPITNFPDYRCGGTVSSELGTVLVVPRERQLVRYYIPLEDINKTGEAFDRSSITLAMLKQKLQRILSPYEFDFQICEWWTIYRVRQGIASKNAKGRVFLAGDAVHTHSPKMGLGMNMSIQDSFNLGWKVALVAKGLAHPSILDTYETERRPLAEMLIDFDRNWYPLFQKRKTNGTSGPSDYLEKVREVHDRFKLFVDGQVSLYGPSLLVDKCIKGCPAKHLTPGERLPPARIRNQASGNPSWTTHMIPSDGRFRILLLAGDIQKAEQNDRVVVFSKAITALLRRFTADGERLDSIIEVKTIHTSPWENITIFNFLEILRPLDEVRGWDSEKIWCDGECPWDSSCGGTAYDLWGVEREKGALVVMRPDQHVGYIGELEDVHDGLTRYFEGFLRNC
ncbi:FAD binding domain-containing protein [Aspergillus ambiguus]|uniref:putative phenol 2-monooxygenase n=1 Tax=Aspergillus ambiguus TaxID=176160 RepID=UPI003CCD41F5